MAKPVAGKAGKMCELWLDHEYKGGDFEGAVKFAKAKGATIIYAPGFGTTSFYACKNSDPLTKN